MTIYSDTLNWLGITPILTLLLVWTLSPILTFYLIRHIAITNCPFRFAFSHLPKCGQLLRQKGRKTLHEICVQGFLKFSDSNKPSQSVSLIYELA